jgi:chromate transporter
VSVAYNGAQEGGSYERSAAGSMQESTLEQSLRPGAVRRGPLAEVAAVFLRLGLTSFGGPIAHLGYFRAELVERRKWLDDSTYADLVALCQFLPGPASSQVGIALGTLRAGLLGGLVAWLGFTLPSALLMIAAAYGIGALGDTGDAGWLHGLKIVAVAVVVQALWGMARSLSPDRPRATIAILAAVALLAWPAAWTQILVLAAGGLVGWRFLRAQASGPTRPFQVPYSRSLALACWALFFGLLLLLPLARALSSSQALALADSFYRAGSLVFGGGHVVLPLLEAEVVPPGWVTREQFIAGYGVAQAVPGPLFTFAAYLGAVAEPSPNGWLGGLIALVAIFLSSWLLVLGALPFWDVLRARQDAQGALRGVNAAVVGVLLAALYTPVWTSAIRGPADVALGLLCFGLLVFWKLPPWAVVVLAALAGALLL